MAEPARPAAPGGRAAGNRAPGRMRAGPGARLAPARTFVSPAAMDRSHNGTRGLDPILTRKSSTSHKGVLVLVAAFVLFVAYVNNVGGMQQFADSIVDNLNQSAHEQNGAVVTAIMTAFPYMVGLLLLMVLVSVVRGAIGKHKDMQKERRLSKRDEVGMDDFIDESVEHGVSAKVAREAYWLLQVICSDCMRARFDDDLKYDLHLQRADVTNMYAALIKKSDRMLRAERHGGAIHDGARRDDGSGEISGAFGRRRAAGNGRKRGDTAGQLSCGQSFKARARNCEPRCLHAVAGP